MPGTAEARKAAEQLRVQAEAEGWDTGRLVAEISTAAGVSLLAAHRHARGWSQQYVAERLTTIRRQAAKTGDSVSPITRFMVSNWETGKHNLSPATLDGVCLLYETRPDRIGFGVDHSRTQKAEMYSPSVLHPRPVPITRGNLKDSMTDLDDLRELLTSTLGQELAEPTVELYERKVRNYNAAFRARRSTELITDIAADLQGIHKLLQATHTPDLQSRLLISMAYLSGMLAVLMVHVGDTRRADDWLLSSQLAADQSGDRDMRAWVLSRKALVPFYYGNLPDAQALAQQALHTAGRGNNIAAVVGAVLIDARTLAEDPHQRTVALARADQARAMYSELAPPERGDCAIGITDAQVSTSLSGIYLRLGDTHRAYEQQQVVLDQVTGTSATGCLEPLGCLDPTLTALDQAFGHVLDNQYDRACVVAAEAILRIPETCRTLMVRQAAGRVAREVPASARSTDAYQMLRDILTLGITVN